MFKNLMIKTFIKNFLPSGDLAKRDKFQILNSRSGQSLMEILIALAVGSILIGAAALGIAFMIRSTSTNQNLQTASGLLRETVEKLRSWSGSDWQNTYSLTKGLTTKYFLNASSTTFYAVEGEESVLESEVRGGLVGRWGLDESTGTITYDMSGNNNNGTLYGVTRATSSVCKASNCGSFNGSSDYMDLDQNLLDGACNATVSLWIKRGAWNEAYNTILTKSDGGSWADSHIQISRYNTGDTLSLTISDNTNSTAGDVTTGVINEGQWHHITMTWDGVILKGYVDGSLVDSVNTNICPASDSTRFSLGRGAVGTNRFFNGLIDDVRIYNRALSLAEIKRLMSDRIFTRYFSVENTCRSTEATSTIGTTPCSIGYFEDPSTQKVTAYVKWQTTQTIAELKLIDFLTRWKNEAFHQQDWSGGAGYDGPFTVPNNKFATSTSNINIDSQGVIKVQ